MLTNVKAWTWSSPTRASATSTRWKSAKIRGVARHGGRQRCTGVLNTLHATLPHVVGFQRACGEHRLAWPPDRCSPTAAFTAPPSTPSWPFLSRSERSSRADLAITTINPGAVNTPFIDRTTNEDLRANYRPQFDVGITPEYVAEAALFAVESRGKGIVSETHNSSRHKTLMTYKLRLITSSIGWGGLERNLLVHGPVDGPQAGHRGVVRRRGRFSQAGTTRRRLGSPRKPSPIILGEPPCWMSAGGSTLARESDLVWIRAPRDLDVASRACRQTGTPLLVQQAMQISKPKTLWWHKRRYRTVDAWVSGLQVVAEMKPWRTPPFKPVQTHVLPLPSGASRWFDTSRPDAQDRPPQPRLGHA